MTKKSGSRIEADRAKEVSTARAPLVLPGKTLEEQLLYQLRDETRPGLIRRLAKLLESGASMEAQYRSLGEALVLLAMHHNGTARVVSETGELLSDGFEIVVDAKTTALLGEHRWEFSRENTADQRMILKVSRVKPESPTPAGQA